MNVKTIQGENSKANKMREASRNEKKTGGSRALEEEGLFYFKPGLNEEESKLFDYLSFQKGTRNQR